MIIDAKTGTINAVLFGKDSKEGGVRVPFRYPERADILTMDKDQIFKAVCEVYRDMNEVKHTIYDIKLTFTADPVCIDRDAKEMTVDGLYKSFKQSLEEIAEFNAALDVAVEEASRNRGKLYRQKEIKAEMIINGKTKPEGIAMNDLKEIAEKLNGLGYRTRPGMDIIDEAKKAGIVIVYGASDDLMEIDGAVHDEIGCFDGGFAYFTELGLVKNLCHDDDCPYARKEKENAASVEALWCKESGYSWTYKTAIPHECFEVLEDGEPYCRGIVFKLSDLATR